MLNRLRQLFQRTAAPERPITINPDRTFTVNDNALDAAVNAAGNRWHWPEVDRASLRRHDGARGGTARDTTPDRKRRTTRK